MRECWIAVKGLNVWDCFLSPPPPLPIMKLYIYYKKKFVTDISVSSIGVFHYEVVILLIRFLTVPSVSCFDFFHYQVVFLVIRFLAVLSVSGIDLLLIHCAKESII